MIAKEFGLTWIIEYSDTGSLKHKPEKRGNHVTSYGKHMSRHDLNENTMHSNESKHLVLLLMNNARLRLVCGVEVY
ncbi:hypothetical protein Lalb_Chr01g0023981 [Lupinus albus]|uniref:Uncharacterized protein n=1 Tax=Lupinus albus TaxID=3870 RepID=A0A6A4R921_LUPAL|nr:hypothetical protein Lalb_Chr01g0023981 [Lupinus albus]